MFSDQETGGRHLGRRSMSGRRQTLSELCRKYRPSVLTHRGETSQLALAILLVVYDTRRWSASLVRLKILVSAVQSRPSPPFRIPVRRVLARLLPHGASPDPSSLGPYSARAGRKIYDPCCAVLGSARCTGCLTPGPLLLSPSLPESREAPISLEAFGRPHSSSPAAPGLASRR